VCFAGLNKAQCQKTNILTYGERFGVKFNEKPQYHSASWFVARWRGQVEEPAMTCVMGWKKM